MNVQLDRSHTAETDWPRELLEAARLEMDPDADRVVDQIYAQGERAAVNALVVQIVHNDQLVPDQLPETVQRYLRETRALPAWADRRAIARGQELFATHGPLCFVALIASSLPETYAIASIAEVLGTTQQLEAHATRRILKTAQLLVDVMSPGGLDAGGRGVRAAQRVRLLHASIRHLILAARDDRAKSATEPALARAIAETVWPVERRGMPICQEDMAYTILTFSCVVLAGLERLQQELNDEDRDAFVHTWAVVGSLMGVRDDLLPRDFDGARRLLRAIHDHQATATEAGRLLTGRTLDAFHDLLCTRALPGFVVGRGLCVLVARTLLSERTADLTGVPRLTLMERLVAVPVMHLATMSLGFVDWLAHRDRPALFVQKLVARHMVDHLVALSGSAAQSLFWMPPELRRKWSAHAE